jgi:FlaG/FlaF family flagellin (archaellin)
MKNVRKITKIRRSIKAISPVISVLLMIAIAVVASLVVYAWVMGYIGGTTSKVGNAITVPSFATDQTSGNLIVYVQNVGQGSVQLDPAGAVYVNDALVTISTVNGNPASGLITIPEGQTVALVVNSPYNGGQVAIKVVTTGGTSMQTSGTGGSGGGSATLISTTLSCTLSSNSITLGQSVTASGSLMAGSTGVSGKIVTITYSLAGQADVVDTKATDSSGAYSDSYTPNAAGSWSVTASFAGDSTYALSSSAAQSLAVNVGTVAITITSSQTGSGFVTVDGNSIATPQIFNWVPGASHTIAALSPVSGPTGTQYVYTSWSDSGAQSHTYTVPSSDATVTANYKTQYQLTMATNYGTTTPSAGSSWYDAGSQVTISATAPSAGAGEQYVWNGWTGTGSGSYTGTNNPATNAVTMNAPITETASWTHQYYFTVTSVVGSPTGQGWYNAGSSVSSAVTSPVTVTGPPQIVYTSTGWTGTGSAPTSGSTTSTGNFIINAPSSVTWNWHGVMTLYPNGYAGSGSTQFTPYGYSNNWQCVSDAGGNDNSNYVYRDSSSGTYTDYYLTQDHGTATGTINSVTAYIRAERYSGSNTCYGYTYLRLGSSTSIGGQWTLPSTWTDHSNTLSRPGGGSWSWTDIDNLQSGVVIDRASSTEVRCTLVWVVIDFSA